MMRTKRSRLSSPLYAALVFLVAAAFFHARPAAAAPFRTFLDSIVSRFTGEHAKPGDPASEIADQDARIRELEGENLILRRDLAVTGFSSLPKTLVRVLWYDPDPAHRAMRILIPEGANVGVGDAVVTSGEVLVGKIAGVRSLSADVLLIDDPTFRVSAGASGEIGVAEGNGRGRLDLRFLPRDHGIAKGDAILTAGKDGELPQGLFLGW